MSSWGKRDTTFKHSDPCDGLSTSWWFSSLQKIRFGFVRMRIAKRKGKRKSSGYTGVGAKVKRGRKETETGKGRKERSMEDKWSEVEVNCLCGRALEQPANQHKRENVCQTGLFNFRKFLMEHKTNRAWSICILLHTTLISLFLRVVFVTPAGSAAAGLKT